MASSKKREIEVAVLDLSLRSRVVAVEKEGKFRSSNHDRFARRITTSSRSKILIDATEYGDVIPLTGADIE